MVITSSVVCYLLSNHHENSSKIVRSSNIPLKAPFLYNHKPLKGGYLYLIEDSEFDENMIKHTDCAFIIYSKNTVQLNRKYKVDYMFIDHVDKINLFNEVIEIFQELQNWDCLLKDAQNENIPLSDFFSLGQKMIVRPFLLVDRNLNVIAYSSNYPEYVKSVNDGEAVEPLNIPPSKAYELLMDEEFHYAEKCQGLFYYPSYPCEERFLCLNVLNGTEFLARILTPCSYNVDEQDQGDEHIFHHFASYVREIYLRNTDDVLVKHQNDSLHNLIRTILFQSESGDLNHNEQILSAYGWKNNHEYSLIQLQFIEGARWEINANYMCLQLEKEWYHSCAIKTEDRIIWIVNHSLSSRNQPEESFFQSLVYIIREYVCKAGISNKFKDFSNLRTYFLQSDAALTLGQKKDSHFWYYRFKDYLIEYIIEHLQGDFSCEHLCNSGLLVLMDYDTKNNTEYTKTLYYYLAGKFNITHAADNLYIHRTTFIRRMERIKEIANINLEDMDEILHLLMSYKMLEYKD